MSQLEQLAEMAETHLQSHSDFYRAIDMMRHIKKDEALIKRSQEIKEGMKCQV